MNDKRKKKQAYYQNKKAKRFNLEPGIKGFLCSCNTREKECVRESYNILNKYADQLYGSEKPKGDTPEDKHDTEEEEIEDQIENELKKLREENSKNHVRRFQVVDSGAKNIVFIRTTLDDPVTVAHTLVKDIHDSKTQQTRFLIRLLPVEATCKAYVDDIKVAIAPLIGKYFSEDSKVFSIIYNHRNNNSLSKDEVIKTIGDLVSETDKNHTVNLKNPELSIIIEVIKGFVLISVVPDFYKYKKYNILVNCSEPSDKNEEEKDEN